MPSPAQASEPSPSPESSSPRRILGEWAPVVLSIPLLLLRSFAVTTWAFLTTTNTVVNGPKRSRADLLSPIQYAAVAALITLSLGAFPRAPSPEGLQRAMDRYHDLTANPFQRNTFAVAIAFGGVATGMFVSYQVARLVLWPCRWITRAFFLGLRKLLRKPPSPMRDVPHPAANYAGAFAAAQYASAFFLIAAFGFYFTLDMLKLAGHPVSNQLELWVLLAASVPTSGVTNMLFVLAARPTPESAPKSSWETARPWWTSTNRFRAGLDRFRAVFQREYLPNADDLPETVMPSACALAEGLVLSSFLTMACLAAFAGGVVCFYDLGRALSVLENDEGHYTGWLRASGSTVFFSPCAAPDDRYWLTFEGDAGSSRSYVEDAIGDGDKCDGGTMPCAYRAAFLAVTGTLSKKGAYGANGQCDHELRVRRVDTDAGATSDCR
jgi:hypothetical protein